MPLRLLSRRRFAALGVALALLATAALAQEPQDAERQPSIPEMEAGLEKMWAATLAMDDSVEPMWRMEGLSMIGMQEFMLDRARAVASGVPEDKLPGFDAARDRVVARWRRERPGDPAADVFLLSSIEDIGERLAPMLALQARHPNNVLVMSATNMVLQNLNQTDKASELLEGFLQRNPNSEKAYQMLAGHYRSVQDESKQRDLIMRWAQREPVDPGAVRYWLGSPLAQQDPAGTAALLDRFFAGQPRGAIALSVCGEIALQRAEYRDAARACVARTAGGDDGSPAAKQAAEQARAQLAAIAARDGDWQGLLDSLGRLPQAQRQRALLGAVHQVAAPAGCETRVQLLRAAGGPAGSESERRNLPSSIAAALHACAEYAPARAMYLDLLRTSPGPDQVVSAWTSRMRDPVRGDRWLGDLPAAEAAPILERRLRESPAAELAASLYRALDVTYWVAEDYAAHGELLVRWHRQQPDTMGSEQTVALAEYLLDEGKPGEAIALLEARAKLESALPVHEMLWEVHQATGHPEQAQQMVADLLASDDEWRAAAGQLLSGRGALLKGDLAAAEAAYGAYLRKSAQPELAAELVAGVGERRGPAEARAVATRLCADGRFPSEGATPVACAAALLARGGDAASATRLLAQQAAEHPNDLVTLRNLAWKAQEAQQWEIAEQTRRQIVAVYAKDAGEWVNLGVVLEKRGKTAELERLLGEARGALGGTPPDLLRAAARAWTAAGDGRRAVSLLEEARAAMPAGAELGWIDQELRQAYGAVGRWENPYAVAVDESKLVALGRAGEAGDLDAAFDFGVESVRKERSSEQCERGIAALERAARAGHKKSAAYLGRILYYGTAPCRAASPAAALGWLRQEVDATTRRPEPLLDLGLALLLGDGGPPEPAQGMSLIERAAAFPQLLAVEVAGLVYATGAGMPRDMAKARHFFGEADRLGSDSLDRLSSNAGQWRPIGEIARRGVERLEALAGEGDPAAMGLLARLHQLGRLGVRYDPKRAVELAQPAAARGDALAMRVLMYAYGDGNGAAKSDAEAVRWLRAGAEAGNSYCMMFLAQRLRDGDGVPKDSALGLSWLERAARAGNYWALVSMARVYAEGAYGVARDADRAVPWMRQLADQGDFEARGWLVLHGQPVQQMRELEE